MKREDNKHTIAKIYGHCFKLSPGNNNKLMKNAVLVNISFSIETIKIFPELFCDKNGKRVFVVAFIKQ